MTNYIPVKDHRNIWLYWEHQEGVSIEPPHIRLCRKAIYKHADNATVHLVTPENLYQYLPNLTRKIEDIRGKKGGLLLAVKCDVIRAYLLHEYGGLYLDSDTIPLKPIAPIFDLVEKFGFVAMQCQTLGHSHISVGVYGSRSKGVVIRSYVNAIRRRMFIRFLRKKGFGWTSLGQNILTRSVNRHRSHCYLWPENMVQPITYQREHLFLSTELNPKEIIPEDALFFTLYHHVFDNELKGITEDELLHGDMLVSKILRMSLGI